MLVVAAFESMMRLRGADRRYYLQQEQGGHMIFFAMDTTRQGLSAVASMHEAAGFRSQWAAQLTASRLNAHDESVSRTVTPSKVTVFDSKAPKKTTSYLAR